MYYVTASTDVQVSVLEVAEPERLETVVDGETGLDAIDERLQAFLHQRHLVRQRHVFDDLTANNTQYTVMYVPTCTSTRYMYMTAVSIHKNNVITVFGLCQRLFTLINFTAILTGSAHIHITCNVVSEL